MIDIWDIKLALRISHSYLDDEIDHTIEVARAEMLRSGISENMAHNDDDRLIYNAIKTYCMYAFANDSKMADGYFKSWEYQLDNLRKTAKYSSGGD